MTELTPEEKAENEVNLKKVNRLTARYKMRDMRPFSKIEEDMMKRYPMRSENPCVTILTLGFNIAANNVREQKYEDADRELAGLKPLKRLI